LANDARFAGATGQHSKVYVRIFLGPTVIERRRIISVLEPDHDESVKGFTFDMAG